jgi:hypothetical protein
MEHRDKMLNTWIDRQNQCHRPGGKLWFRPKLIIYKSICQRKMTVQNHVMQVSVGFVTAGRDIIFIALK